MIRSRANPAFKSLKRLARSSRERRRTGRALLEGARLVEAALRQGGGAEALVLAAGQSGEETAQRVRLLAGCEQVTVLSDKLFGELSAFASPTGVIAVFRVPDAPAMDLPGDALFLDGIQDPGNLGMILRSAAASGTVGVFLSGHCADPWSPKVLRAGMGAHFAIGVRQVRDLAEAARDFAGEVIALDAAEGESLFEAELPAVAGFVIGSEGAGVSASLLKIAKRRVAIPMPGWKEPLNAAAAASVCLFERVRQRLKVRETQRDP